MALTYLMRSRSRPTDDSSTAYPPGEQKADGQMMERPVVRRYLAGHPRPLYRGWLHSLQSLFGLPLALWFLYHENLEMAMMLLCKWIVITASAIYHRFPFASPISELDAHVTDCSLIPLAIFGSIQPFAAAGLFASPSGEVLLLTAVIITNTVLTRKQFLSGKDEQESIVRVVVCFGYYIYNELVVGRAMGWTESGLWLLSWPFYCSAMVCSGIADDARKKREEPVVFPWHWRGVWSAHEDAHLLLFLGDLTITLIVSRR